MSKSGAILGTGARSCQAVAARAKQRTVITKSRITKDAKRHGGLCQVIPLGEMRGQQPAGSANICERRDSCGRRETARAESGAARTSREKTPPPSSASQPASIRLIRPPDLSTITARGDSRTSGRQSGATQPVACGGVLLSSRVARVRNAPQPESSPSRDQQPAGPANICERRDSCGRRETARAESRAARGATPAVPTSRSEGLPRHRAVRGTGRSLAESRGSSHGSTMHATSLDHAGDPSFK